MSSRSHDEVRGAWEANAKWWSDYFQEGNDFHLQLVAPPVEELLDVRSNQHVLDIACGNGAFSRRLVQLGARVTAFDFSAPFIACAQELSTDYEGSIVYHTIDATARDELLSLGEVRFDAAVSNMALMDMEDLNELAACLPQLLKPGGRFVFSIMHPCFNNPDSRMTMEHEDRDGALVTTRTIRTRRYLSSFSAKGIGIAGQPVPQTYFHRPLSALLEPFLNAGFAITGLKETAFKDAKGARHPLSWDHFQEIPPVLVVRLRHISQDHTKPTEEAA